MKRSLLCLLPLLAAVVVAEPDPDPAKEAVERGRKLFHDTQELMYPSCAHCHTLLPPKDEASKAAHLGPGASLWGAAVRQGWRNMNTYADVGEALQVCAKRYQERKGGFKAAQRKDLVAFLRTHGPKGPLPKRKVERKPKLIKAYEGGDKEKGKKTYERYCTGCHNRTDDAISFHIKPGKKKKRVIARSVRGYDNKGKFKPKTMSYYTTDRLTDEQLLDILAYLGR